jgi:uncharacterized protein YdaL
MTILRFSALAALTVFAALLPGAGLEAQRVAIIYDGPTYVQSKGYIHALFIENLLGHFGLEGDIIPLSRYKAGSLEGYRAGFFSGVAAEAEVPRDFLADVRAFRRPFAWLGQHIGDLLATEASRKQFGLRYIGYEHDFKVNRVVYKDTPLIKVEPDLTMVEIIDRKGVQVVATALTKENASYPYVIHRGNFWFFGDSPFAYPEEGGHYLAFADLLHDVLAIDHPAEQKAMVRIEDVSAEADPDELRGVADLLAKQHIPFQIALIPVFRDPAKGVEIRLSDSKLLTNAVHYMIARGGTPVLHGITHQYRGATGRSWATPPNSFCGVLNWVCRSASPRASSRWRSRRPTMRLPPSTTAR